MQVVGQWRININEVDVGQPTLEEALFLFRGVVRGIMAAHERGVIHRDLKPANIMLAPTNEGVVPKVTDFGLVKSLAEQRGKTQTGMAMGTPEYMSPEQIVGENVDERVDIYARGVLAFELVTGYRDGVIKAMIDFPE